ncbi:MAG: LysM peptidoglycan-binding domain-containing protein, partial [Chloroflexota bacterium]|nr:LysM peptidoglycan-binding domain-containing protein [Chloroflexota bacterium]
PEPRSHAHQQRYCLTPNYPSCAHFQDWASRRAARLVGTPATSAPASWWDLPPAERSSERPPGQIAAFEGVGQIAGAPASARAGDDERPTPPAIPVLPRSSTPAAPTDAGTSYSTASRLLGTAAPASSDDEDDELEDEELEAPERPRAGGRLASWLRRPDPAPEDGEAVSIAPMQQARRGIFETRRRAPQSNARPQMPWERARRRESYPNLSMGIGASGVPGILIALAVVAVMAAIVFLLPGLLAGPSRRATEPTPTARAQQTALPAGATPAPNATSRSYTVARGDTVERIARRFNITVRELLAANPRITDPNRIRIGDRLTIPARR